MIVYLLFLFLDPSFTTNIKPHPDDYAVSVDSLLRSRYEFFDEGSHISRYFFDNYKTDRRVHYNERIELFKTLKQGLLFYLGMGFLDALITVY